MEEDISHQQSPGLSQARVKEATGVQGAQELRGTRDVYTSRGDTARYMVKVLRDGLKKKK